MKTEVIQINKTTLTLSAIILALIVYIVLRGPKQDTSVMDQSKAKIDSLNQQLVVLKKEQATNDSIITNLKEHICVLDGQIDTQKDKIAKLKKQYGTTIQIIHNYTPAELERFFAERYK